MNEPTVEFRPEFCYLAFRQDVTMSRLSAAVHHGVERVAKYLRNVGLKPAGPPFVRYVSINMMEKIVIETGFPLDERHNPADPSLVAGIARSGYYVCGRHVGAPESLVGANSELQQWAASHGVALDVCKQGECEQWAGRFEHLIVGPDVEGNPEKWVTLIAYRAVQ